MYKWELIIISEGLSFLVKRVFEKRILLFKQRFEIESDKPH